MQKIRAGGSGIATSGFQKLLSAIFTSHLCFVDIYILESF